MRKLLGYSHNSSVTELGLILNGRVIPDSSTIFETSLKAGGCDTSFEIELILL